MLVLEQMATVDKDFLSLRLERSQAFLERNAGFIGSTPGSATPTWTRTWPRSPQPSPGCA
jgi:hypothetical protein